MFPDQTGKFPIISSRGNKYIMVMFVEDANAILAEPLKSRSERDISNVMIKLHTYLTDRGFKLQTQILDNECPGALKRHFQTNEIDFQLVPPISIVPTKQKTQSVPLRIILLRDWLV